MLKTFAHEGDNGAFLTAEELVCLAEMSFIKEQWDILTELCLDSQAITYATSLHWGEPPTSVCSLSLMLLTKKAQEYLPAVVTHIEKNLDHILSVIRSGSDDAREYAVMLLSAYVKGPTSKTKLLKLGGFNILCRFLMCSNNAMRTEIAATCHAVYAGSTEAQKAFVNANGGDFLVQLISRNAQDPAALVVLLKQLEDLMLGKDDQPQSGICISLNSAMAWEVLRCTQAAYRSGPVGDLAQHLLTTLTLGCRFN